MTPEGPGFWPALSQITEHNPVAKRPTQERDFSWVTWGCSHLEPRQSWGVWQCVSVEMAWGPAPSRASSWRKMENAENWCFDPVSTVLSLRPVQPRTGVVQERSNYLPGPLHSLSTGSLRSQLCAGVYVRERGGMRPSIGDLHLSSREDGSPL